MPDRSSTRRLSVSEGERARSFSDGDDEEGASPPLPPLTRPQRARDRAATAPRCGPASSVPLWSRESASRGSGEQSERSRERSGTYGGGEEEEEEGCLPPPPNEPPSSRVPAKRALRAADSCSGSVVLEKEMTAPMSFEERGAPVLCMCEREREKEKKRESGHLVGVEREKEEENSIDRQRQPPATTKLKLYSSHLS